ncbi:MAG: NUDIX hydrolase [Bacteroidetes bacterium]|nr:NUDIX hydrolase [Bacteroidota bacterium]
MFNIRVYGLLINEQNEIMLVQESYAGRRFTKFPGGGLEFGEGTIECVVREFKEEFGIAISVKSHFYTTDFFQPSAFDAQQQIISIYYLLQPMAQPCPTAALVDDVQIQWKSLRLLNTNDVTFPIDKEVVKLLIQ